MIKKMVKSKLRSESMIQNPYVVGASGRREWNDRYDNMRRSIQSWQRAFFCAIGISVIFALIVVKMANESHVQPFVVETNHGMPYAVKPMTSWNKEDPRLINFAINQFIVNARTVMNDSQAEQSLLNKAYAYSADNTLAFLREFYEQNNPFKLSEKYTVGVTIQNALPLSHETFQVTWDETKRSTQGDQVLEITRWVAHVTYRFGEINPHFMTDNPFGFYITNISWSKSQSV